MKITELHSYKGVICYWINLFGSRIDLNRNIDNFKIVQDMMATDLWWYWESQRNIPGEKGPITEKYELPDIRQLKRVMYENVNIMIAEWCEANEIEGGRNMAIIGVDKGTLLERDNKDNFRNIMRDFACNKESHIRMVIMLGGENSNEDIYVPNSQVDSVRNLLGMWGLPQNVTEKLKMRGETYLEYYFGSTGKHEEFLELLKKDVERRGE
jgi:hypothetical protein